MTVRTGVGDSYKVRALSLCPDDFNIGTFSFLLGARLVYVRSDAVWVVLSGVLVLVVIIGVSWVYLLRGMVKDEARPEYDRGSIHRLTRLDYSVRAPWKRIRGFRRHF